MTGSALVRAYLDGLAAGNAEAVIRLFVPGAVVHSPLYGPTAVEEFYPALFAATGRSELTLLGVMEGTSTAGVPMLSFLFRFGWHLASGADVPFDCVDVAELAEDGRIASLRLLYDTVNARPAFEADHGGSWRPGDVPATAPAAH